MRPAATSNVSRVAEVVFAAADEELNKELAKELR
jgi:hypothetical protein